MILKNFLIILISVFISISCSRRNDRTVEQVIETKKSPEVLTEYVESSFSIRKGSSLIERLYEEGLKKDLPLKQLDSRIEEIAKTSRDSLEKYDKYLQNNSEYWRETEDYINRTSDSLLKEETRRIFKLYETEYNKVIAKHKNADSLIALKSRMLNDQLVLMKLFISVQMMKNYQENELPDIRTMENLVKSYDTLIKEANGCIKRK